MEFIIRPAVLEDAVAITDIYNHYVIHSTATYAEDLDTVDERRTWLQDHGGDLPVLVAEENGQIVGWASLSLFRSRRGWRFTVENSVYIHPGHHRRGLGRCLMLALIPLAQKAGYHSIIAGVSGDQEPSIALHEALGFRKVAHIVEGGYKMGRWLDVVYLQLML